MVYPLTTVPAAVRSAWAPRIPIDPETWVSSNVYFSGKTESVPGYWSHKGWPYSRGVLRAFTDPAIRGIVLPWGTRVGKTSILTAMMAHQADQDPRPAMVGHPNDKAAKEYMRLKLLPMFMRVAKLRALIPPPRKRTHEYLDIGSAIIYQAWSGARHTVSMRSVKTLYVTEANLWTRDESSEGDPVAMAMDRLKDFPDAKWIVEGKPTVEGECRVFAYYNQSDRRRYYVPCPLCGFHQTLEFGGKDEDFGLKFEKRQSGQVIPESVRYLCRHCHEGFTETHKPTMNLDGVWARDGETVELDGSVTGEPDNPSDIAGFHLSSLYSNVVTWVKCVTEFLSAKRTSIDALKNYVQGWLAKCWKLDARQVAADELTIHHGSYLMGSVPGDAAILVCAVDVQLDHLWYVIRAYGAFATSWLVRCGRIETLAAIDGLVIGQFYRGLRGNEAYRVNVVIIDSSDGNRTSEVYDYCVARIPQSGEHWAIPCKFDKQYGPAGIFRVSTVLHANVELPLWWLDAGHLRDQFFDGRMKIGSGVASEKKEVTVSANQNAPGFWWFAADAPQEYTASLLSWKREKRPGKPIRWVSTSDRYEHLADCETMCEAVAGHYGVQYWEYGQFQANVAALPKMETPLPGIVGTANAAVTKTVRRQVETPRPQQEMRRADGRSYWDVG